MIPISMTKQGTKFFCEATVYEGPLFQEVAVQVRRWSGDPMIALGRFIHYEAPKFGLTRDVLWNEVDGANLRYFLYAPAAGLSKCWIARSPDYDDTRLTQTRIEQIGRFAFLIRRELGLLIEVDPVVQGVINRMHNERDDEDKVKFGNFSDAVDIDFSRSPEVFRKAVEKSGAMEEIERHRRIDEII